MDEEFENAANELDASMKTEEAQNQEPQDLSKAIQTALTTALQPFLQKGPKAGGVTSDLKAETDKRGSLVDSGSDPAETPIKSGKGYKDSRPYSAKKAGKMDDDDYDDDGHSYFRKKKKKKVKKMQHMKKSEDDNDDEGDDDVEINEEFFEDLGDAVDHIAKSADRIEEGVAIFGELLAQQADPRRDKLTISLAKAVNHVLDKVGTLQKSLDEQAPLMKALTQLPGIPKIAGMSLVKSEDQKPEGEGGQVDGNKPTLIKSALGSDKLPDDARDRLFKARMEGKISPEQYNNALQTKDLSVLEKVGGIA